MLHYIRVGLSEFQYACSAACTSPNCAVRLYVKAKGIEIIYVCVRYDVMLLCFDFYIISSFQLNSSSTSLNCSTSTVQLTIILDHAAELNWTKLQLKLESVSIKSTASTQVYSTPTTNY